LATARAEKVSLLIFPELAIPTRIREEIRRALAGHGPQGHPILTLFGCCHRPDPQGGDLNEAVLSGPDGVELCCHRKLTSFTTHLGKDRNRTVGERLRVGTTVTVLESSFGNLTPLICLDFIHMPLRQVLTHSHANLFAVSSLSPSTSAHQDAARALQTTNRASSFVSNRALEGLTDAATSFFRVPRKGGFQTHLPHPVGQKGLPYLLFSWAEMDKAGK
jgi:predicted amidohydrolase